MKNPQKKKFVIVSDGACRNNPGPGGWGLIFITPDEQVTEFGGFESESTNNRMELTGFYRGLQEVYRRRKSFSSTQIHFISDSKYVLDGAEKFIWNWKKNGWKTGTGDEVKNLDLWQKILKGLELLQEAGFSFEYELVKGHAGNEANERVDQIAVKFSREEAIDLYEGPLKNYSVSVTTGKAFAVFYLSFVDGVLKRHSNWDSCQKEMAGRAGARCKKIKNSIEEKETLKSWGMSD